MASQPGSPDRRTQGRAAKSLSKRGPPSAAIRDLSPGAQSYGNAQSQREALQVSYSAIRKEPPAARERLDVLLRAGVELLEHRDDLCFGEATFT